MLVQWLQGFWRDDQGQDLTEYTLLIATVALVAFAVFASTGRTAAGVWSGANHTLNTARGAGGGG